MAHNTKDKDHDGGRRRSRFVATVASAYGLITASILVNLWLTPFVLRFISREEYAVFVLALDVIVWLGFLDLGMTTGLGVRLARLRGNDESDEMSKLASSAFVSQFAFGIFVVVIGIPAARWFPVFFGVPDASSADAVFLVLAVVVGTGLSMPAQTYSAILVGGQRGAIDNIVRFGSLTTRVGLTVVLLLWGHGLRSLGYAHLAATLVSTLLLVFASRRVAPQIRVRPTLASLSSFRKLWELGVWLSIGNLATIAIRGLDRAIAGRIVSLESVAILELTGRVYQPGITATGHFVTAAKPLLGEAAGTGDRASVFSIYRRLLLSTVSVTILLATALWAVNGAFVKWWVGGANYGGATLDLFLAANMVLFFVIRSHKNLLTVSLVAKPTARIRVTEAVLNLSLSILLGYRYGITGIAAATTIAALTTSAWMIPHRAAKELRVPFAGWARRLALPLVVPTLLGCGAGMVARATAESIGGLSGAIVGGGIVLTVGAPLFWFLALDGEIRNEITRLSAPLVPFWRTGPDDE